VQFDNPLSSLVAGALGDWLAKKVDTMLYAFAQGLPDLVSLGVVACALAMMIPGTKPYKWFGRAIMILWLGIVLIILCFRIAPGI